MDAIKTKRIAIMLYRLTFGGVERAMLTLSKEFVNMGIDVDIVACEAEGELSGAVPDKADVVDLGKMGAFDASRRLTQYLNDKAPDAIIACGDRCTMMAYLGRKRARRRPKIFAVVSRDLVGYMALAQSKGSLIASIKKIPMAYIYPKVDRLIAISSSVADSTAQFLRYPRENIRTIYCPLDIDRIQEESRDKVNHPWFAEGHDVPVITSVGRLTQQKDYSTLIKAYSILTREMPAHLAIIGEGLGREKIEDTIEELGVGDTVMLFGYQRNPHKYVAKSDLFALSSAYEGFGMAIAESLAVGTPAVATDCQSGPAEILGTKSGLLAPVGDPEALAKVMADQLKSGREPHSIPKFLKTPKAVAERYLKVIEDRDD